MLDTEDCFKQKYMLMLSLLVPLKRIPMSDPINEWNLYSFKPEQFQNHILWVAHSFVPYLQEYPHLQENLYLFKRQSAFWGSTSPFFFPPTDGKGDMTSCNDNDKITLQNQGQPGRLLS